MNKWNCKNCGGLVSPAEVKCLYCGSKITASKSLSQEDKKRIISVAKIMAESLWMNSLTREYRTIRTYIYVNMAVILLEALLLFHVSASLVLTGTVSLLLGVLVFSIHKKKYWFLLLDETVEKIYNDHIKPAIHSFLISFNYYGCDWEKLVLELLENHVLVDETSFLRSEYSSKQGKSGKDAVLNYADEIIGKSYGIYSRKRKILSLLAASYIFSLTPLVSFIFSRIFWIPLIWTVPLLVATIVVSADKNKFIYLKYNYFFDFFSYHPYDPDLMKTKIVPLLKQYCSDTGTSYRELIEYAKKIEIYPLYKWLERSSSEE